MRVPSIEIGKRMSRFKAAVQTSGVKLTHQRLEIFREVAARLDHPDAEAVFRAVHPTLPTVSLDTVYRTLWLLHDLGLVSTLGARRESVRFDANRRRHHHYVCLRCGLTRDIEGRSLDDLRVPRTVKTLGSVVATHVEIRGLCARCRKAAPARPVRRARRVGSRTE